MSRQRLADIVEWRVARAQPRAGALSAVRAALSSLAASSGPGAAVPSVRDQRLPRRPGEVVAVVEARGRAPWIPLVEEGAQHDLRLYEDHATANPSGVPGDDVVVDLTALRVRSARLVRRDRRRADHLWELHVLGPGTDLRLTGTWLHLAWAGHLGGWPEPDTDDADRRH